MKSSPFSVLDALIKAKAAILCFASIVLLGCASAAHAQSSDSGVILIQSNKVAAAFAKGGPLLERKDFKIQAGRRDGPGEVEFHARDTDIFHILSGTATFVTGGTTVDPKNIAPGEIRGKAIKGGEAHHLKEGDVIVIPKGVPHWFKEVHGPFLYYVIKITEGQ